MASSRQLACVVASCPLNTGKVLRQLNHSYLGIGSSTSFGGGIYFEGERDGCAVWEENHKVFTVNPPNIFQRKWKWRKERTRNYVTNAGSWKCQSGGGWECGRDFRFFWANLAIGTKNSRKKKQKYQGIALITMLHKCHFLGLGGNRKLEMRDVGYM